WSASRRSSSVGSSWRSASPSGRRGTNRRVLLRSLVARRRAPPHRRQGSDPSDRLERIRTALAVFLGVFAHELLEVRALRERLLMQVPVMLGDPEVEICFGPMGKVPKRAGRAYRLDRRQVDAFVPARDRLGVRDLALGLDAQVPAVRRDVLEQLLVLA